MTLARRFLPLGLAALLAASATATQAPAAPAKGPTAMVAAANPMAVDAGLKVLKAGGSAADAAVAVQAVVGLVEPQSSGVGGGAFMTYYDAKTHKVTAYNGRETAPAGATPDMFLGPDGKPMSRATAMLSGRSAGVPGAIAMLYLAHQQHGKLPWKALFGEARTTRLRPSYFPFPEPSAEFDMSTPDGGWIELGGCGMVHPNVLRNCELDPEEWSGFAFGFGIDRLAKERHGIDDIREFVTGDLRFLRQF